MHSDLALEILLRDIIALDQKDKEANEKEGSESVDNECHELKSPKDSTPSNE